MLWEVKIANNLRSKERHDVRTDREGEAGEDLFTNGGAAQYVTTFEHQCFLAGARKVRRCY